MNKIYPEGKEGMQRKQVSEFYRKMEKKDLAVVATDQSSLWDICIITGDYEWKDIDKTGILRYHPQHRRDVVYLKIGPISKNNLPDGLLSGFIPTLHEVPGNNSG